MNFKHSTILIGTGICVSLIISGCGGSSSNGAAAPGSGGAGTTTSAPATSSSAPQSGSQSPQSGSPSAAGQQYLSLTAPANTDLVKFLALPDATPIKDVQAAAAAVVSAETTLVAKLKQASWPANAAGTLTALESSTSEESPVYAQCAKATSVAAVKSILKTNQAKILARSTAAAQVRAALGIPAVSPSGSPGSPSGSASA